MSGVSLPVDRPTVGRALIVSSPSSRPALVELLARLGFDCVECDDPFTATLELCRRRLGYRALILSLSSLYREELSLIATVKRRFPHLEIWLAHTDGRQSALAESMRLGADGLVDDEGLHRIAAAQPAEPAYHPMPLSPLPANGDSHDAFVQESDPDDERGEIDPEEVGEPVLSADELRALLQDPPVMPPSGGAGVENQV